MNKLNIHIPGSLEIFSTFNIHHPVYGCLIHVHFNLTKSTIVNQRFGLSMVCPADKLHLAVKKVSRYLKKLF